MLKKISAPAGSPAEVINRLFGSERDARALSVRSGISEVTLRKIAVTGRIDSYATALALEVATDRAIDADAITDLSTKGARLYRREPARSVLKRAIESGIPVASFLRQHDLTISDLFTFMNADEGRSRDTKARVQSALRQMGIPTIRTEPGELVPQGNDSHLEEA